MGPVRQNPIQRTVSLFICVCIALCTIVAHNIAQNRRDNFPPYPPLLQRCHSTEANQTLHDVWPSPGLVDYLYIFGGCCPVMEFCQVQSSLCVLQVLHSIGNVTARHSSSGREPNFAALSTRRHLYSAGRPSRLALAHILVFVILYIITTTTTTPFVTQQTLLTHVVYLRKTLWRRAVVKL